MPYPINQRAHQFNSIQSVSISFGLWDTALKFLSPGPLSDVTDHLEGKEPYVSGLLAGSSLLRRLHCPVLENEWKNGERTRSDSDGNSTTFPAEKAKMILFLGILHPGTAVFPFPEKPPFPNSRCIWYAWKHVNEFLRAPL